MKPFTSNLPGEEETGSVQGIPQLFLGRRQFLLIHFLHLFVINQINFRTSNTLTPIRFSQQDAILRPWPMKPEPWVLWCGGEGVGTW